MGAAQLVQWQWEGYSRYHRSRSNLLMHIVAVPLFLAGNLALVLALLRGSVASGAIGLACMIRITQSCAILRHQSVHGRGLPRSDAHDPRRRSRVSTSESSAQIVCLADAALASGFLLQSAKHINHRLRNVSMVMDKQ
jgi:hypothetical protein